MASPTVVANNDQVDWETFSGPETPTKEPATAPPATKPSEPEVIPMTPTVEPGRFPDPGTNPTPACPPSTCPMP